MKGYSDELRKKLVRETEKSLTEHGGKDDVETDGAMRGVKSQPATSVVGLTWGEAIEYAVFLIGCIAVALLMLARSK